MAFTIPYTRETLTSKIAEGVEFDLLQPAMLDVVRLRGVHLTTAGLLSGRWTAEFEDTAIAALRASPQIFENCVRAIRGLSAPAELCRQVGVVVSEKAADTDLIPIENGHQFARVAPYLLSLAIEVAMRIQALSAAKPVQNGVVATEG